MSSCLSASGNGSTQTRHLAPRCSPPIGRPHPDGQYCSTIKTLVFTLHRRHRYSCSGPDASKGAWKLGGGYAGLQPQIKLSLVGRKKWGRSPLTGRHQLLYFSSFLTSACADPCRCPFFSILFFPPPDTETGSQIQSNHQGCFSFTARFITSHCWRGTRIKWRHTHTHSSWLPALCSPAGARAIRLAPFMGPSLSCPSAAVHSASITAPAGRHRTTGREGKRLRHTSFTC